MSVTAPTMKDNKQTIYAAYTVALDKLNKVAADAVDPTVAIEEAQVAATIVRADGSLTSENLDKFRKALTLGLGTLSTQMDGVLEEYTSVKDAVNLKKQELEDVYKITVAAKSLAALFDTQRAINQTNYETREKFRVDFEKEREETTAKLQKEQDLIRLRFKQETETAIQINKRDQEKFNYDFRRDSQALHDKLNDELNTKRKAHDELMDTDDKDLTERETVLIIAEKDREDLENKVRAIPTVIAEEVRKQVGKEKGMMDRRTEDAIKLLTMDFKGQKAVVDASLAATQSVVYDLKSKNDSLSEKLDKAYSELRELAQATVAGPSLADLKEIAGGGSKK